MLEEYNKKRNFKRTKEPVGKIAKASKKWQYIIQHHLARKDHFDFRLEYNGVLVSFAVPKNLSLNPQDKRLAIRVEDHPLSYRNFEGTIAKGEYGAGIVMLWDKGTWTNVTEIDFNNGFKFKINGSRLKGIWTLVKFKENFLIIKENDQYIGENIIYDHSIKTNRTFEEIKNNIVISSPDKIIYPEKKIDKEKIINYYSLIYERMEPFLSKRLISTVRCPSGINKEHFYMKHLNTKSKNLGVKIIKDKNGAKKDYYYIKNKEGLLEEVNYNSYEFHIWCAPINNRPNILVFDFDPDQNLDLNTLRNSIKLFKKVLDHFKLKSYLKTSGKKGYHIFIPLNCKNFEELEEIALNIARVVVQKYPDLFTLNIRKKMRKNKIFLDYLRNKKEGTIVAPYSLRLNEECAISCPIKWNELNKVKPNQITIENFEKRLKLKDPWSDFFL